MFVFITRNEHNTQISKKTREDIDSVIRLYIKSNTLYIHHVRRYT